MKKDHVREMMNILIILGLEEIRLYLIMIKHMSKRKKKKTVNYGL